MQVGDRIKFQFGDQEKEGVVEKIFPKKVYLRVDFPGHPGKRIIRPVAELEGKMAAKPKKKKKVKTEKGKEKKAENKKDKAPEEKD